MVKRVEQNNRLIANFMGYDNDYDEHNYLYTPSQLPKEEITPSLKKFFKTIDLDNYGKFEGITLNYHSSWDWLMPVVEKIEDLGYGVTIYRKGCHINDILNSTVGFRHSSKKEQTYKAVIDFIEWYNKQ